MNWTAPLFGVAVLAKASDCAFEGGWELDSVAGVDELPPQAERAAPAEARVTKAPRRFRRTSMA